MGTREPARNITSSGVSTHAITVEHVVSTTCVAGGGGTGEWPGKARTAAGRRKGGHPTHHSSVFDGRERAAHREGDVATGDMRDDVGRGAAGTARHQDEAHRQSRGQAQCFAHEEAARGHDGVLQRHARQHRRCVNTPPPADERVAW
jgi:hypothetical protein